MLDPQGVADVLVISLRTLAYVRDEDETFPPPRMVGRLPRWSYESIREWVEAATSAPTPAGPVRVPVAKKASVAKRQTGVARVH